MEIILSFVFFALAMAGMGIGVLVNGRRLRGSCGGDEVHGLDGDALSCGACPRNEAEICPSDDDMVRLAVIAHPDPRKRH
jgi:hypothetical protein